MSEEQKAQAARIFTEVNALDAAKQEVALAYIQGIAAGAKMMQEKMQKQPA